MVKGQGHQVRSASGGGGGGEGGEEGASQPKCAPAAAKQSCAI